MRKLALFAVLVAATVGIWFVAAAGAQSPAPAPAPSNPAFAPTIPDASLRPGLHFPGGATVQPAQGPRGREPAPLRDPTEASPDVRRAIEESQAMRKPAGNNNAPAPGQPPGISQINLKARVISSRTAPIAVLEINGTNYLVHADTNLALTGPNQGMEIKILELTAQQVRVEVLPLKKQFVLH